MAETLSTSDLVDLAILDDDPDFRNYLEDALKDDGLYSIRTFASRRRTLLPDASSVCPTSFCST